MQKIIFKIDEIPNHSINDAIKSFEQLSKDVDNMIPFWRSVKSDINDSVKREFSNANPNRWKGLDPKYKQWKSSHGFPTTIGVKTGALKKAASDNAEIFYSNKYIFWNINSSVDSYSSFFDSVRPIFTSTIRFIENNIERMITNFFKLK